MKEIVLVGVVHRDPRGPARLRRLLARLRPDRVAIEVSPFAVRWRRGPGREIARRLPHLREVLRLPFEYRAARAYRRAAKVPLDLIESSRTSRARLRRIEDEVSSACLHAPDPMAALAAAAQRSDAVEAHYRRASLVLRDPHRFAASLLPAALLSTADPAAYEELVARDRRAARRLGALVAALPAGARLVHVGGWEHLALDPDRTSLYARLRRRRRGLGIRLRRFHLRPGPRCAGSRSS